MSKQRLLSWTGFVVAAAAILTAATVAATAFDAVPASFVKAWVLGVVLPLSIYGMSVAARAGWPESLTRVPPVRRVVISVCGASGLMVIALGVLMPFGVTARLVSGTGTLLVAVALMLMPSSESRVLGNVAGVVAVSVIALALAKGLW